MAGLECSLKQLRSFQTSDYTLDSCKHFWQLMKINDTYALQQQDVYINRAKVREFQFQIDNLFGCSGKPFSCDVEIRHADQLTMLPIEIEVLRSLFALKYFIFLPYSVLVDIFRENKVTVFAAQKTIIISRIVSQNLFVISLYKFLFIEMH